MVRLAVLSPETPTDCGHYLHHLSYGQDQDQVEGEKRIPKELSIYSTG
jgi:hypothetical protein